VRWAALTVASTLLACGEAPIPPTGARIHTVVGTGEAAWDGDGRIGTETALYAPIKVLLGPRGRMLVLDWNNHRLREIQDDGTIVTVLGTGIELGGDVNALSIAFSIHHPFDFKLQDGQLYFAGYHDPRLLKVDQTDHVRGVAGLGAFGNTGDGGPAGLATFNAPTGVAAGPDGRCWISDELNNNVRYVDEDGIIHPFAGTSSPGYAGDGGPAREALLKAPSRLERDANTGDIYLVDSGNHAIRKIDAAGIITTVAGTGAVGSDGDGGPATSARLYLPRDLVLLDDGSFLIADAENHRIRRVGADGIITTIAGTGAAGHAGDGGPAAQAELNTPWGIAVDPEGRLWIADTINHRVRVAEPELLGGARPR
jgi:DNA-binding beta-propeller fold protein YncE